jgi:hypothetical protein
MEREGYMPEELTWQFAFRMALTGTAAQPHTPYEQTLDITYATGTGKLFRHFRR